MRDLMYLFSILGTTNPVDVYIPIRKRPTYAITHISDTITDGVTVGRDLEIAKLKAVVVQYANGSPARVILEGPTGSGKTILGDYLKKECSALKDIIFW
jgi:DNA-binding NtrC family response regulator